MPQATLEEEGTSKVPAGSSSTSTSTSTSSSKAGSRAGGPNGPTGPGTLRQRFKLTVDDISKEVEELSVKLKRKVSPSSSSFWRTMASDRMGH